MFDWTTEAVTLPVHAEGSGEQFVTKMTRLVITDCSCTFMKVWTVKNERLLILPKPATCFVWFDPQIKTLSPHSCDKQKTCCIFCSDSESWGVHGHENVDFYSNTDQLSLSGAPNWCFLNTLQWPLNICSKILLMYIGFFFRWFILSSKSLQLE